MKRYEKFIKEYNYFYEKATKIIEDKKHEGCIDSIEFEDNTIKITCYIDSNCGCCPGDYEYYELTPEELFTTNELRTEKLKRILK